MKTLFHPASQKYWTQKAYDRWAAGRDSQDMPLHEAWTADVSLSCRIGSRKPHLPDGCEFVALRGRPPGPTGDAKQALVKVRCDLEEKGRWTLAARKKEKTLSEWLRDRANSEE